MSLLLKDVYENTKRQFKLELVCGEKGLRNIMDWFYISENIGTAVFIKGGELVITTGYCSRESENWLHDYISLLIEKNACGLIINIGEYIQSDDLSQDIIDMCNEKNFPVFFMPWEILFYDITKEYCNRIYHDSQREEIISNAFLRLAASAEQSSYYTAILEEQGCRTNISYTPCYITLPVYAGSLDDDNDYNSLKNFIRRYIHTHYSDFFICSAAHYLLLAAPDTSVFSLKTVMKNLAEQIKKVYPRETVSIGIGSRAQNLSVFSKSCFFAKSAAKIAAGLEEPLRAFEDLGFFKLLISVNDRSVLEDFRDAKLASLTAYDTAHDSKYTETLKEYLYCDGSVQKMAEKLYCHRNTVNYRIRFLREEMKLPLDDVNEKFQFMTAFQIDEYLQTMGDILL